MIKNIIKYKFAAFALAAIAAGTLASCSSVADETAPESKTVTASMDGISKPAFAPSSRTTTDLSTLASAWEKSDQVKVTFTFYSDEAGTTAIDASDCPDGTTQNLSYNGTEWGIYPKSLRIPTATRSLKADYSYSKNYGSLKGKVPLTAAATTYTIYDGKETITGTSGVVVPTDITSLAITLKPLTLTRDQGAIAITDLAQGQQVTLNINNLISDELLPPTTTTDGTHTAVNAALRTTYIIYLSSFWMGKTTVTATAGDNQTGFTPSFTTEAGKMYIVHAGMLFGGAGDPNGGQPID